MRFLSKTTQGQLVQPSSSVHADVVRLYYGTDNVAAHPTLLHDLNAIEAEITMGQSESMHEGVTVDPSRSPFDSEEAAAAFLLVLQQMEDNDYCPPQHRWASITFDDDSEYPDSYEIRVGRRGGRTDAQRLPVQVWKERGLAWARALDAMERVQEEYSRPQAGEE